MSGTERKTLVEAALTAKSNTTATSKKPPHAYLSGNFAPINLTLPLTPCHYTGTIPPELTGGQYVRNGGNPFANTELERSAHWFDGDGMLSGVFFSLSKDGKVVPEFTNQYVLTDLFLSASTSPQLKTPIMPSIATLVNPASTLLKVMGSILRTVMLVILSHLPGSQQAIKKISVGNTNVIYHDGRALATCESGPPMRVQLPGLETVGWYNGITAEGEAEHGAGKAKDKLGKGGPLAWTREWTTAHPKVDPRTGELIMFHSIFSKPFVQYSVIPQTLRPSKTHSPSFTSSSSSESKSSQSERTPLISPPANYQALNPKRLINANIPGISSPKMMHDFGVSSTHTIILDLPLSLDPMNIMKGKPSVHYDPIAPSRFGIIPRYRPEEVKWFETKACCIFHTANCWTTTEGGETKIHLLACRLTSAGIVFVTGDIVPPVTQKMIGQDEEEEQCRLYYFQFNLTTGKIEYEFALSAIAFEFPSLPHKMEMQEARYLYGTSAAQERFDVKLAAKIDCLVKVDVLRLIEEGKAKYGNAGGVLPITGCVDQRSILQILEDGREDDAIKVFRFPPRHFAQECQFVPRAERASANANSENEDHGYLLTYVFDESQLGEDGEPDDYGTAEKRAKSELWVIGAEGMEEVVGKIRLPCRVPYGLHGNWFPKDDVDGQRAFDVEQLRRIPTTSSVEEKADRERTNLLRRGWGRMRNRILDKLA